MINIDFHQNLKPYNEKREKEENEIDGIVLHIRMQVMSLLPINVTILNLLQIEVPLVH